MTDILEYLQRGFLAAAEPRPCQYSPIDGIVADFERFIAELNACLAPEHQISLSGHARNDADSAWALRYVGIDHNGYGCPEYYLTFECKDGQDRPFIGLCRADGAGEISENVGGTSQDPEVIKRSLAYQCGLREWAKPEPAPQTASLC